MLHDVKRIPKLDPLPSCGEILIHGIHGLESGIPSEDVLELVRGLMNIFGRPSGLTFSHHMVISTEDFDPSYGHQKSSKIIKLPNNWVTDGGFRKWSWSYPSVIPWHDLARAGYGWSGWVPLALNSSCCPRQIPRVSYWASILG